MVGAIQRDETLGMLGGVVDRGGVLDPDRRIDRRMEHHQRLLHAGNAVGQVLLGNVLQKLLFDGELPASERDLRLAVLFDAVQIGGEIVHHMGRIGRRADGGDRLHFRDVASGGQHRRAAQRMADQDGGCFTVRPHPVHRAHQIGDVGGKVGRGEIAVGMAKAGEIKAQRGDAVRRQFRRDALGGKDILRTGEAMGEQGAGARRAGRTVKAGGKLRARSAGERYAVGGDGHAKPPGKQASGQMAAFVAGTLTRCRQACKTRGNTACPRQCTLR